MARAALMPPPGVVRGATPNLSAGRWFDSNLIRWRGGQAQPVGGWASLPGLVTPKPCRDCLTWHSNAGKRWGVFGCDTGLFAYDFELQILYDITPAGVGPLEPPGALVGYGLGTYGHDAYGTARDPADIGVIDISPILGDMWSMDLFGEDLLIVPTQDGRLFHWSPLTPTTLPLPVAGAPIDNSAVVVTDERHVVLLGAGGNKRRVQWSDQEALTVWAPLIDNLAGDKQLETEGRPLNAIRVPTGGVLLFTDNDVHLMRYVGPPYAYGINKIASNCGLASLRSLSQAGGSTVWVSPQSFWRYDGSVLPLASPVGDWMFSLINRSMVGRLFAAVNPAFSEHWFFWPSEDDQECGRYVLFNYAEGAVPWAVGQLKRTAADIKGAMVRPIMTDQNGHALIHEYGWLDDGASRIGTVYLETGDVMLDPTSERRFHVTQIAQDFTGPANACGYRFFLWEEPDGPQWDTGSYPILNDSGLTDARFSARGFRMRIEGLADVPFAIGRTRLIARPGGQR